MKLAIPTKKFHDALSRLSTLPGASRNGASLQTQAIRFEAGMDGLTLTRITSEAKISITLDEVVIEDEDGPCMVDYDSLTALISRLPKDNAILSNDAKTLHCQSGPAKAKLAVFPEEAQVQPPKESSDAESIRMDIKELYDLLKFAANGACKDSGRPNLCGVCLRPIGGTLAFIGSNGRMAHISSSDHKMKVDVTLSNEAVDCILAALRGEVGGCELSIGSNVVAVKGSNVELIVPLLSERFPNITPMLKNAENESSIQSKITANKEQLMNALKTCATVGKGTAKLVTLTYSEASLNIQGSNERDSEMDISMDCQASNAGSIILASLQVAGAVEFFTPDEDGNVELIIYPTMVFIRQPDKIAFSALSVNTSEA